MQENTCLQQVSWYTASHQQSFSGCYKQGSIKCLSVLLSHHTNCGVVAFVKWESFPLPPTCLWTSSKSLTGTCAGLLPYLHRNGLWVCLYHFCCDTHSIRALAHPSMCPSRLMNHPHRKLMHHWVIRKCARWLGTRTAPRRWDSRSGDSRHPQQHLNG